MKRMIAAALCFVFVLSLGGCGKRNDPREKGESTPTVVIDNVEYSHTGEAVPVEPDERSIEYVEIPVGGGSAISAFARLDDGKTIVCLIDGEWYRFLATDRVTGFGEQVDSHEKGTSTVTVVIDNVVYSHTGEAVPVEPDERTIEYVEIPVGGCSVEDYDEVIHGLMEENIFIDSPL